MKDLFLSENFADEKKKILSFIVIIISFTLTRTGRLTEAEMSETTDPAFLGIFQSVMSSISFYGLLSVLYTACIIIVVEFIHDTSILSINYQMYGFVSFSFFRLCQLISIEIIQALDANCPLTCVNYSVLKNVAKIGGASLTLVGCTIYAFHAYILTRRSQHVNGWYKPKDLTPKPIKNERSRSRR
jgi:hypothetical protein